MTTARKKSTPKSSNRRPAQRATATHRVTAASVPPAVAETGRNVLLASLGLAGSAVEKAAETFDALVARGRKQEPKAIAAAERVIREAKEKATDLATEAASVSKRTLDSALDGVQKLAGVEKTGRQKNFLHRLGDLAEAIR